MSKKLSDYTSKDFEKLSKSIPKFEQFKSTYNLNTDLKPEMPELENIENPIYELLEFMQSSTLEQSETSKRQSKDINIQFKITGYFGVTVPLISVKQCHFERSYNYIKN